MPWKLGDDLSTAVPIGLNPHPIGKLCDERQTAATFGKRRRKAAPELKSGAVIGDFEQHTSPIRLQPDLHRTWCMTNDVTNQFRIDQLSSELVHPSARMRANGRQEARPLGECLARALGDVPPE